MANYEGILAEHSLSDEDRGLVMNSDYNGILCFRWKMTTDEYHGGEHSIRISPGGMYSCWAGCGAGTRKASVWVKFGVDAKPRLEIWDIQCGQRVASAIAIGEGDWEKLEAEFVAEKKIYLVKMINYGSQFYTQESSRLAYFDDLMME